MQSSPNVVITLRRDDLRNMPPIYKILTTEQWTETQSLGHFSGSPADLRDGFIHFSTAEQVAGTLQKHFFGQTGLLLAEVDPAQLADSLKWEPSRNDQLFPHLYSNLPLESVTSIREVVAADWE